MSIHRGDIEIGFRSPGLSQELDAAGKMAFARELGFGTIEPQCNQREIQQVAQATAIGAAAREAGIAIRSFGCILPLHDEGKDLAAVCDFAIEVSRALGCDYVFAVVRKPVDPQEPQAQSWQRATRLVREAVQRLGDSGLRLGIEPDHGAFVQNAERLEQLLDAVDDQRLLVNLDLCNLYLGGSDPHKAIRTFASRVFSGHIKDGFYRCGDWSECAIGSGELDWAALFATMQQAGLACPMHIEHCNGTQAVRDALDALRPAIKSAPAPEALAT